MIYTNTHPGFVNSSVKDKLSKTIIPDIFALGYKTISLSHIKYGREYHVEASAVDNIGIAELKSLLQIIIWVLGFSLVLIVGFGFYNAVWSLKPFQKIIKEVEKIDPNLLNKRMSVSGNDEISQLAKAFNILLDRIEQAFETEKSFISNASHELRTPVTSVMGQIEVVLNKSRKLDEYRAILESVYEDTLQMANIINGFLELAEANLSNDNISMISVRIDELIYNIVDDFEKRKPHYNISVEYHSDPENDSQLECLANDKLLSLMFSNLIDNACKYSSDKKAKVNIGFSKNTISIAIIDFGIGIPAEDLENIFKPLYRGNNTSGKPGHGIGLAIVKRIADLHGASLEIRSEINLGTTITVLLKTNLT
jgi:signal transduction histidine kinase